MSEYIYIANNKHMQGLLKIGFTKNPSERLISLQTTGVPTAFELIALFPVDRGMQCERAIHSALNRFRVERDREFFSVSVSLSMEFILPILSLYLPSPDPDSPHFNAEQNIRFSQHLSPDEHLIVHWISTGRSRRRMSREIYARFTGDYKESVDRTLNQLVNEQFVAELSPFSGQRRFELTTKGATYIKRFPDSA